MKSLAVLRRGIFICETREPSSSFARHPGAGRDPVTTRCIETSVKGYGFCSFRENRTVTPLDPGLRRDDGSEASASNLHSYVVILTLAFRPA